MDLKYAILPKIDKQYLVLYEENISYNIAEEDHFVLFLVREKENIQNYHHCVHFAMKEDGLK